MRPADRSDEILEVRVASVDDRLERCAGALADPLSRVLVRTHAPRAGAIAFLTARAPQLGQHACALSVSNDALHLLEPIVEAAEREAALLGATELVVEGVGNHGLEQHGFVSLGERMWRAIVQVPRNAPIEQRFLFTAARAVAAAGQAIIGLERESPVAVGADGQPTEAADRAAESAALLPLLELGLPVLSEEAGLIGLGSDESSLWVTLDPLDGSRNFRAGLPPFATAIGLVRDSVAIAGFVLEHTTGRRWWAVRGEGAWIDGVPLRRSVSRLIGMPSTGGDTPAPPPGFDRVRISGSTSIDLCHVADGSLAAYRGVHPAVVHVHDLAPCMVMIEEAGGVVLSPENRHTPELVADPLPTLPLVAAGNRTDAEVVLDTVFEGQLQ